MKKVILITGASSGIGKVTALQLIKEGHIVYGAARRLNNMNDLLNAGGKSLQLDITDPKQIQLVVSQVIEEQGKIDVLFNNAGYAVYGALENVELEDAKRQFEVNIFGLSEITKAVLPHMRKQNSGTIINTSSMGGRIYTPLGSWYHATKHALEGLSDCLRLELKQFKINVVVIQPGGIHTEFGDVLTDPMVKRAKGTVYEGITNTVANATKRMYDKPGELSPPSVIADLVSKAVNTSKPKNRYVAGKFAKQMMFIRKYFGDNVFDKLIMNTVK